MACRIFGAKSLSQPMHGYHKLDPWEQTSVKFRQKLNFSIQENVFENVVAKWRPFCPVEDELIAHPYRNLKPPLA